MRIKKQYPHTLIAAGEKPTAASGCECKHTAVDEGIVTTEVQKLLPIESSNPALGRRYPQKPTVVANDIRYMVLRQSFMRTVAAEWILLRIGRCGMTKHCDDQNANAHVCNVRVKLRIENENLLLTARQEYLSAARWLSGALLERQALEYYFALTVTELPERDIHGQTDTQ
jgi:hypothetical protein